MHRPGDDGSLLWRKLDRFKRELGGKIDQLTVVDVSRKGAAEIQGGSQVSLLGTRTHVSACTD